MSKSPLKTVSTLLPFASTSKGDGRIALILSLQLEAKLPDEMEHAFLVMHSAASRFIFERYTE